MTDVKFDGCALGYAVVIDGDIDVKTVSPTERGAHFQIVIRNIGFWFM